MAKRLELVWPHKGETVLQNPETGKWEFCGDNLITPPRPLIEIDSFGTEKGKSFDPQRSNLLIKGENLFALKSLLPYYASQVKLIYIDPPFNTGRDFETYNDNFQHSVWLSMLKERIEYSKLLLSDNGVLFIHLNMEELSHCKIILDEIMGRKQFLQIITAKAASTASFRAINLCPVTVTEYILMYAKDRDYYSEPMQYVKTSYKEDYGSYIKNFDKGYANWEIITLDQLVYEKNGLRNWQDAKEKWGKYWKEIRYSIKADIAFSEPEKVVSLNTMQKPSDKINGVIEQSKQERDKVFIIEREKYDPIYVYNGRTLAFFKNKIRSIDGELVSSDVLTNFWEDISYLSLGLEGDIDFKNGKKPEKLLKRIIEIATQENDLVLDFFAGSGTTGAVAHKMNRRWIMAELNEQAETLALKRLKGVVSGEDQTGIGKQVNWQGGGGFRFLEVGAPLLTEDPETKLTIINPKYTNGPLTRAVCAIEGFLLTGDKLVHGRNGEHYAHITEDFVDDSLIKRLKRRLKDGQFLTIYAAKGVRRGLHFPKDIQVKRINEDLVKKYVRKR